MTPRKRKQIDPLEQGIAAVLSPRKLHLLRSGLVVR